MATMEASRPSMQAERTLRPSLQIDTGARPSLQIDAERRPSFQLFPPPPKQPPPTRSRTPQRADTVNWSRKPVVPKAGPTSNAGTTSNSKPNHDIHELIIRVDSPNSMSTTISAPQKAHVSQSPPQTIQPPQSTPQQFPPPPQLPRAPSPQPQSVSTFSPKAPQSASSAGVSAVDSGYSPRNGQNDTYISPMATPNINASSSHEHHQQQAKTLSPASAYQQRRVASPTPTEKSQFGRIVTSPESSRRAPSPAFSEARSQKGAIPAAHVGSPDLSSSSTYFAPPPIRSIFPEYDFTKPLAQQQYRPVGMVPESIPMQIISKPPYSPEAVGGFDSAAREPYFTPAAQLASLWDAANGSMDRTSPQLFTLQVQSDDGGKSPKSSKSPKSKAKRKRSQIAIGPSGTHGFYTISMEDHSRTDDFLDASQETEVFVLRNHPTQPTSLPVAHINITPPPHLSTITRHHLSMPPPAHFPGSPNPSVSSPTFAPVQQHEAVYLVTTIFSKLAALKALEDAASSPAAVRIAQLDPNATSPAAAQLAEHAVRDAEDRESSDLLWVASSSGGKYQLRHPQFGILPIKVEGNVSNRFTPGDMKSAGPGRSSEKVRIAVYPPENPNPLGIQRIDSLASLDLISGALTLDAAAMQDLGSPFLIDTLATALFAIAAAESRRGADPAMDFAAPPVTAFGDSKSKGKSRGGKEKAPSVKKLKAKAKEVIQDTPVDFDLEAQTKNKELPKATRSLLSLVGLGLKLVVWLLQFGVKILVRVIVALSNRHTKP